MLSIASLCACESVPEAENLLVVPEAQAKLVTLSAPMTYGTGDVGLLAGTYRLEKENQLGQYFVGTRPAVWLKLKDEVLVNKGGIWIPKTAGSTPRIYFYNASTYLRGKSLDDAARNTRSDTELMPGAIAVLPGSGTPLQAGVGAGVGIGIAAAIAESGADTPVLYPAPGESEFSAKIRQVFGAP